MIISLDVVFLELPDDTVVRDTTVIDRVSHLIQPARQLTESEPATLFIHPADSVHCSTVRYVIS